MRSKLIALRVKPIVKITGEFWAQTTEGDGNFNMFQFPGARRRAGAGRADRDLGRVSAVPGESTMAHAQKKDVDHALHAADERGPRARDELPEEAGSASASARRCGEHFYHRVNRKLGGITHHAGAAGRTGALAILSTTACAGGEGHLEVGKNVYYTDSTSGSHGAALKPFGCMPSTQSDGAQSAVD